MTNRAANFDPLARVYRALEFVAFGGDLERARYRYLDRLADARRILVLGEGDGRCLARLLPIARHAFIHCIDSSSAMLELARRRVPDADRPRVQLTCADLNSVEFKTAEYDAVTTFFFLDCFPNEQAWAVVRRIEPALQRDALWLFADFVLPPRGWRRLRGTIWLAVLYAFFRWQTGLKTRRLPESEHAIKSAGFRQEAACELQHGLVRSAVFRRARA